MRKSDQLRQKAEKIIEDRRPAEPVRREIRELVHELTIHQVELEVQNEELREAQRAAEQAKNDFFELYEFAPVGYLNLNEKGLIIRANLRAAELLGKPRGMLIDTPLSQYVDLNNHSRYYEILRFVLAEDAPRTCELRFVHPDRSPCWIRLECVTARDSATGRQVIRATLSDVTDLNETRWKLDALNRELEKKVAERTELARRRLEQLKLLNRELIHAEQRERNRLAELLHDNLQQLLVGCRFSLSVLRGGADGENLKIIDQAEEILQEAIDVSRNLTYELCPPILYTAGLGAGLDWLSRKMQTLHDLKVRVRIPGELPRYTREIEVFLFECARELLLNVVKHSGSDSAEVAFGPVEGGRLLLSVTDGGKGFAEQVKDTLQDRKGGFGLYNMRIRTETMEGTFHIESAPGQGTRVEIAFPIDLAVDLQEAKEAEKAAALAGEAVKTRPIKVMLVDDHRIFRQGLKRLLDSQKDMAVVAEAGSGEEAIGIEQQVHPDIVLMDIGLPGMDGIETATKIKEADPDVSIIALSMHDDTSLANRMIEVGADRYITKDAPVEDVVTAIRQNRK